MNTRFLTLCACAATLTSFVSSPAHAQKPFHITDRWVVGGEGGWDYLTADPASHRLYITHTNRVEVLDTTTGKSIGAVTGLTRTHGVVIMPDGKTGFVSDGGANQVVAFDTKTFAAITKIPAGTNPDGIAYEPTTNTIWAFNGRSKDATVIDVAQKKSIATIPLPGKPEFPQADGKGTVFVNIEDKNSIVRLDAKSMKATATWPLTGCDSPSGMAIDASGSRLFSVCDGNKMAVTDATTGKSLATPKIGADPDAAGYDPKSKLAFSSNGEGSLTIVDASKPGYPVLQTLTTEKGARTMSFDSGNGKVYLVTSKFAPADPANPKARPAPLSGTFTVLVVGR
ncbi:YncE family protein [Granulicella tundricola]|uniref:YVTN family beta-propeller repeat protein n=1 Tax=Granulicella tundricola (strain ATCC BAA-1859 / DSM 23138 / MP5ACTX9) TaxID=1198114 RepID=E8X6N7_GRATM|nr:YncE family protein [Granulicella tundricola]ADW71187.1 YVTN family beta-propeller repeat protein [Granulicella tundricola MP5ACTX9]